jgi:two-component system phosphate regulon sensor histidine kinase PhoR
MLDFKTKDVVGKSYDNFFQNDHLISLVDRFFEKPFFISDEIKITEDKIFEVMINPFKVMDTTHIGAVILLKDVTKFKKLEKIRRDFVANVSHEFKNPLASIIGYSESLLDWGLKDSSVNKRYLKKIVKQSRNLENLVSDLLHLARVEGMGDMQVQSFNPKIILKELKVDFSELAAAKNITFQQNFEEPFVKICGDPEMFRTIIANLIDNAIKYSHEGSEISLSSVNENGFVKFSVLDEGLGIPSKYMDRIFERFFRVDKGRSRAVGGTGLGLSIVKHMAELQKAEYGVESKENVGSHFWIKFKKA